LVDQTLSEHELTTQDRLIQTEKLASLGQLTAGIAYEIKPAKPVIPTAKPRHASHLKASPIAVDTGLQGGAKRGAVIVKALSRGPRKFSSAM
jgi:hypothetical protein